jgi:hypothetical protein
MACTWTARKTLPPPDPDWILKATKRLATHELWKEHDGGDNIYIERGCLSETMSDYRHRSRPWTIRCSVFDQSRSEGARSLYQYYHGGVENEVREVERIGEATYLWKSATARAWGVGFCKGRFLVEASLVEEGEPGGPLSDSARQALLEFARRLAAALAPR